MVMAMLVKKHRKTSTHSSWRALLTRQSSCRPRRLKTPSSRSPAITAIRQNSWAMVLQST